MRSGLALAAVVCVAMASAGAMAQQRSTAAPRSNLAGKDDLPPSAPPPISTLSPIRGISGLRLEPGAILCKTDADLRHRAEVNRRRGEGDVDAGDPLMGCRLVQAERGVEVVSRQGLGLVQVRLKPSGEVGWTDAYLR